MTLEQWRRGFGLGRAAFLSAVLWGGCSLADKINSLADFDFGDGASEGEETSALVGPDDEVTLGLKTGAQISIPKGALDQMLEIGLKRPKDEDAVKLVKGVKAKDKIASAPYVLTPHGTQFKKNVEVTLPVVEGRDKENLVVAWLEDEQDKKWKSLGAPEVSGNKAKIKTPHFSVLVLVERGAVTFDEESDSGAPTDGPPRDAGSIGGDVETDAGGSGHVDPGPGEVLPDAGPGEVRPDAGTGEDGPDTQPLCEAPLELCAVDGAPQCVDTQSDPMHCGGCAPDPAAAAGPDCWLTGGFETCTTGCTSGPECTEAGECERFGTGLTACEWHFESGDVGIYCTSLSSRQFCGDCFTQCAPEETCESGECVPRTCPAGQRPCGYFCRDESLSCGEVCSSGTCEAGECTDGPK